MSESMNTQFGSAVAEQIKHLVQTLDSKNFRPNIAELDKLKAQFGYEAHIFLLSQLVSDIQDNTISDQQELQLFSQELANLTSKTNFTAYVIEAFSVVKVPLVDFVTQISRKLNFSLSQQVLIALGLSLSRDSQQQQSGIFLLKEKLPEIIEHGPTQLPENMIHQLLQVIFSSEEFAAERQKIQKAFEHYPTSSLNLAPSFLTPSSMISSRGSLFENNRQSSPGPQNLEEPSRLAAVLKELSYPACFSVDALTEVFDQFSTVTASDVAQMIGVMATNTCDLDPNPLIYASFPAHIAADAMQREDVPTSWNTDVFVSAVKKRVPNLNWKEVISKLDYPDFILYDQKGLALLAFVYKKATRQLLPIDCFLGKWRNSKGQLSFLRLALSAPPDIIDFESMPGRTVKFEFLPKNVQNSTWGSLDLVETLLHLGQGEFHDPVLRLFENPVKTCPEQLLISLAQANIKFSSFLYSELVKKLFTMYLRPHKHSFSIMSEIQKSNEQLLLNQLVECYLADPTLLPRILDIAQELKIIQSLLNVKNYIFSIDLASLAALRDHVNLEKWLSEQIQELKDPFVMECLSFLDFKVNSGRNYAQEDWASSVNISIEIIATFFQQIFQAKSVLTNETNEKTQMVYNQCVEACPGIRTLAQAGPEQFSKEVESLANSHFQSLFQGEISNERFIEMLKAYKSSSEQKEQELFVCMINNLFDETRFFPTYPETELMITGRLFGGIINNKLIISSTLGIALSTVLEALTKPPSENMKRFGQLALDQFKERLPEWPKYCAALKKVENLYTECSAIVPYVEKALNSSPSSNQTEPDNLVPGPSFKNSPQEEPPQETQEQSSKASDISSGFANSLNLDVLLQNSNPVEIPDEETRDNIHFIVNNISIDNLDTKVADLKKILKEEHYSYFAHYMVIKRASIESNFQELYIKFLDALKIKVINEYTLKKTYESIKILLQSNTAVMRNEERTLIKNLGSWLGALTIAKNKPILLKNLDLKEWIFDAYEKGRLIVVIPFVARVLSKCTSSKVFKPPNPWVMALIKLLVEIHNIPDLKLSLKFEVEVLCNELGLKTNEIETNGLLADKTPKSEDNPDFTTPTQRTEEEDIPFSELTFMSKYHSRVVINPNIVLFSKYAHMKNSVYIGIDRSIQDIITPVVERAVTIACYTTRDLITKDFGMESDENKMRQSAHMMVQNLAGNLAMVTSKDPLKFSLTSNLDSLFNSKQNGLNPQLVEEAITTLKEENLDLCCAIVQKAAVEKALVDIDEALVEVYNQRRTLRGSRQEFFDPTTIRYAQMLGLPDSLFPRSTAGVQHIHSVYHGFSSAQPDLVPETEESESPKPTDHMEKLVQTICKEAKSVSTEFKSLKDDSPTKKAIQELLEVLNKNTPTERNRIARSLFLNLFENDNNSVVDQALIHILLEIEKIDGAIINDITNWIIYSVEQIKFHSNIIKLIDNKLIVARDLDVHMFNMLNSEKPPQDLAQFATNLVKQCVVTNKVYQPSEFLNTIRALMAKYSKSSQTPEGFNKMVEEAKKLDRKQQSKKKSETKQDKPQAPKSEFVQLLREWISIANQTNPNETAVGKFVIKIQKENHHQDESFFQAMIELCVDRFLSSSQQPADGYESLKPFQAVDAYSELVMLIIKSIQNNDRGQKLKILSLVLSATTKSLTKDAQIRKEKFNQRPYSRFFSNLLIYFNSDETASNSNIDILSGFKATLHSLQPLYFPAFSFAWLELISHRMFMPKLLFHKSDNGWHMFQELLVDLFRFLQPYLRNAELTDPIKRLYRGTLKILLVLLHDFPEFLCEYHFSFCDVIPTTCIQMRNLILSAFPREMKLPDPFTPNLKVDLLPEISNPPNILSDYTSQLQRNNIKENIDEFLYSGDPTNNPMKGIIPYLLVSTSEALEHGTRYNVPLINSLVLYVGIQAIDTLRNQLPHAPLANSPAMAIYLSLVRELDTEGRYMVLNALANQLRYPNNHTHYFSCILLYIFAEARLPDSEIIQEQITRVLLERLIVNRPHPWGLLITFIELVKNPRYNFWSHSFIHCAPEIEKLFENVQASTQINTMGMKPDDEEGINVM
eukprot:gb/GECH01006850.1/.p1 GENE.gb/GECH01006850.1/~~gb/GECH01006850.1/.p1  ORF type:complete len:2071 (+),score=422.78 gb/GECH01006850.1/:1-6213(+)